MEPKDYVIATGRQSSVRDFINLTSEVLGWGGIEWTGSGLDEIGKRKDNGEVVIRVDSRYFRPNEVPTLLGNSSLAKHNLGWEAKTTLDQLVEDMVKADIQNIEKGNFNI